MTLVSICFDGSPRSLKPETRRSIVKRYVHPPRNEMTATPTKEYPPETLRVSEVAIEGLFGRFNHRIRLQRSDNITIR
jgi:hypothetical protein